MQQAALSLVRNSRLLFHPWISSIAEKRKFHSSHHITPRYPSRVHYETQFSHRGSFLAAHHDLEHAALLLDFLPDGGGGGCLARARRSVVAPLFAGRPLLLEGLEAGDGLGGGAQAAQVREDVAHAMAVVVHVGRGREEGFAAEAVRERGDAAEPVAGWLRGCDL